MIPTLFILTNTLFFFLAKLFQLLTFIHFSFTIQLLFDVINYFILRIL